MKVGNLITTSYIRAESGGGWSDYKAPKGERFVLLLLGTTKKDGSEPFDGDAALNRLGWIFSGAAGPEETL